MKFGLSGSLPVVSFITPFKLVFVWANIRLRHKHLSDGFEHLFGHWFIGLGEAINTVCELETDCILFLFFNIIISFISKISFFIVSFRKCAYVYKAFFSMFSWVAFYSEHFSMTTFDTFLFSLLVSPQILWQKEWSMENVRYLSQLVWVFFSSL